MSRLRVAGVALACVLWPLGPPVSAQPTPARLAPARWTPSGTARPAEASFRLRVGQLTVPLRVMAVSVLPGAEVSITREGPAGGRLIAQAADGRLRSHGTDHWVWTAPDRPGFHAVRVVSSQPRDTIQLTFMVVRPASEIRDGFLHGYAIGTYRPRPASMPVAYEPPLGFVEVRPQDHDLLISPNFRLGQFLCKQPGDPQYVLVSPRLLVQLEALLVAVNEAGYATPSLSVMSGFRTPAYNRAIGNTTDFSRHLWGDAADVFVDADGDDDMDDLNGDSRHDLRDARWLADVLERVMAERPTLRPGGLSIYRRNPVHGPFVHIDARGQRARW